MISTSNLPLSPSQNSETTELKNQDPIAHEEIADEPNLKSQSIAIQEEIPSELQQNMADTNIKCEGNKIGVTLDTPDKDYNEEKEFQRASKVYHLLNDSIIYALFSFIFVFVYF